MEWYPDSWDMLGGNSRSGVTIPHDILLAVPIAVSYHMTLLLDFAFGVLVRNLPDSGNNNPGQLIRDFQGGIQFFG